MTEERGIAYREKEKRDAHRAFAAEGKGEKESVHWKGDWIKNPKGKKRKSRVFIGKKGTIPAVKRIPCPVGRKGKKTLSASCTGRGRNCQAEKEGRGLGVDPEKGGKKRVLLISSARRAVFRSEKKGGADGGGERISERTPVIPVGKKVC